MNARSIDKVILGFGDQEERFGAAGLPPATHFPTQEAKSCRN